jgi:methionyl-tRNA formyltransferase
LDDEQGWEDLEARFGPALGEIFPAVIDRVERGDPGDPQSDADATYFSFFEPEYAWIDWSKPAVAVARQVRAWRFHSPATPHGALTELDGETRRVLRVSLVPAEGRAMECADGTLWIVETEAA